MGTIRLSFQGLKLPGLCRGEEWWCSRLPWKWLGSRPRTELALPLLLDFLHAKSPWNVDFLAWGQVLSEKSSGYWCVTRAGAGLEDSEGSWAFFCPAAACVRGFFFNE